MKKIFCIAAIAIGFYLSSCKKQELPESPKPQTALQSNVEGELIDWNTLPDEYKNIQLPNREWEEPVDFVSARSNHAQDQVFKAFASTTGSSFNIPRPAEGTVIDRVYLGHGGSYVSYVTIWYKRPDGSKYSYTAGGSGGQLVQRVFEAGEYIRSISGTSTGALTSLTVRTNKTAIGAGAVSGNTFSYVSTIGSYIGSFSGGYSSSRVNQINAISYYKPWEQITGSNANDIALDTDGTAYMTGTNGRLYKMAPAASAWTFVNGAPENVVRVSAKSGKVAVVTSSGSVYQMLYNTWSSLTGYAAKDVAVDGQGVVFKTDATSGKVYMFNQTSRSWVLLDNANAKRITAGTRIIRIIHANGRMSGVGVNATSMPGTDGRDMSMAEDNVVWLTNTAGKMYVLQYPTGVWKEIAGADGNNIAAIPGTAMLVNTVGKVYKMIY